MQLIKPSVEIITEPDLFKRIELAARTCYKSEGKIAPGSDMKLFKRLVASGHESTLEHSNIVVVCEAFASTQLRSALIDYEEALQDSEEAAGVPAYIRRDTVHDGVFSGNLRAWRSLCKICFNYPVLRYLFCLHPAFEDLGLEDYQPDAAMKEAGFEASIVDPTPDLGDRHNIITARFTCDRGVSHELVRHRCLSFSQESTRYVNYKDGAQFIEPWWWDSANPWDRKTFEMDCRDAETAYARMMRVPFATPQKARAVLSNALKTEVVATGTVEQWKKLVLPLRLSQGAHPDIRRLMTLFCQQMNWTEFLKEDESR